MKFLTVFAALLFIANTARVSAQTQTRVQAVADSFRVTNGEFVLRNGTRNVKGFLYNNGDGVTSFKSAVSGAAIFYVAKKYINPGKALISGLTLAGITSPNSSYLQQLQDARMGDPVLSYPDPYAARNAAMDSIAAGKIASATIVVPDNQQWYIGSDDAANNGNYEGTSTSGGDADIQFTQSGGAGAISSLAQNKINYSFGVNAGFYYINVTYPIFGIYVADAGDAVFKSSIKGHGFFKQYFGEQQQMESNNQHTNKFAVIDNARAEVCFEADLVWMQQWQAFNIFSYKSIALKIHKAVMADIIFLSFNSNTRNGDGWPSSLLVDIDDIQFSNSLYPVGEQPADYWYFMAFGFQPDITQAAGHSSARTKNMVINFGNLFLNDNGDGALFYLANGADANQFSSSSVACNNTNLAISIKNLYVANNGNPGEGAGLIEAPNGQLGAFKNNRWIFNIDNYVGNDKLFGSFNFGTNEATTANQLVLNIKKGERRPVPEAAGTGQNSMFYLNGNTPASGMKIFINAGTITDYLGNPFDINVSNTPFIISGIYTAGNNQTPLQFFNYDGAATVAYDNLYFTNCTIAAQTGIPIAYFDPGPSANTVTLSVSNFTVSTTNVVVTSPATTLNFRGQTSPYVNDKLSLILP